MPATYILLVSIIAQSTQSVDEELPVHPVFRDVAVDHECPRTDDPAPVTLDGRLIPPCIELSGRRPSSTENEVIESTPLRFVLVPNQTVHVDGIDLDASRPFYIMSEELTNAQFAQFNLGEFENGYVGFVQYTMDRMELEQYPEDILAKVKLHISDPYKPAVMVDLEEATERSQLLSWRYKLYIRLPTIAEWFAAMRAGADTHFWWGDDLDPEKIAWKYNAALSQDFNARFIRRVQEGPANAYGIKNIVGNAGELVFPSDIERRLLRPEFGPYATAPRDEYASRRGYVCAHTTLQLGGSANTPGNCAFKDPPEQFRKGFVENTQKWYEILGSYQFEDLGSWYDRRAFTGVRFVIELPSGDVMTEIPGEQQ